MLIVILVATFAAAPASPADVPSPSNSTAPSCVLACPGGDLTTGVIVRNLASFPIAAAQVVIDLAPCPAHVECPDCEDSYVVDPVLQTLRKLSDTEGHADFAICAGGACTGQVIHIYADGVELTQRLHPATYLSPDQDGNLVVDAVDLALVQQKVGGTDLSADFDCDGSVTASDVAFATAHLGHMCARPTSIPRGTWGRLKQLYR